MDEFVQVPEDLTLVGEDDLRALEARVVEAFDAIENSDNVQAEDVARMVNMANDLDRIRAELRAREVRAEEEATRAASSLEQQRKALAARVHGAKDDGADGGDAGGATAQIDAEAIAAAAARGAVAAMTAVMGDRGVARDLVKVSERATLLAAAQQHAPKVTLPERKLAITASVDIPGMARNADLPSMDALINAINRQAKGISDSRGAVREHLVASIRNEFEHVVDDRTSPAQMQDLIENYLLTRDNQEALLAGGGWCAPSSILYDFFNIGAFDGAVDLPTVGVTRGGIRFPTSPSLADANIGGLTATLSNATNPWLWTETDDILTVTGGVNKPCVRVPCPTFGEVRLECYGICVTAGNLTDDAYPEATRNYLRLLLAAHKHAINGRLIASMVTLSSSIVNTGSFAVTGMPVVQQVLNGVDLAAQDYRERYGMSENDILEVVYPRWLKNAIRADLAWRTNVEMVDITDAQIQAYFTPRRIRAQFVGDWQIRASGQFGFSTALSAWPTQFDFMIYAAGTFVLGNGLQLDLGVIRDSVLNAENDFTAGFTEECHLIARIGHESRQYRTQIAVNGAAQAAVSGTHL